MATPTAIRRVGKTEVSRLGPSDLDPLLALFDGYRQFYGQASNVDGARRFLQDRLEHHDSEIFGIRTNGVLTGFVQLYPSFSSVSMKRLWILNDLFVSEEYRGQGLAATLIRHVQQFALNTSAKGLILDTAKTNPAAALYRRLGFEPDLEYDHYAWTPRLER